MADPVIGRRVALNDERPPAYPATMEPGDYYGPYWWSGRMMVTFLLPIAHNAEPPEAHYPHSVASPPHVFRECEDGSLEIRESIAAGSPVYWHGYLDEGHVWREV